MLKVMLLGFTIYTSYKTILALSHTNIKTIYTPRVGHGNSYIMFVVSTRFI